VLATALTLVVVLPLASAGYSKVEFFEPSGNCVSSNNAIKYFLQDANAHSDYPVTNNCLQVEPGLSVKAISATPAVEFYTTDGCTGAAAATVTALNGCTTVGSFKLKVLAFNEAEATVKAGQVDKPYVKYTQGSSGDCHTNPHVIQEVTTDSGPDAVCTTSGRSESQFKYKKIVVKSISAYTTMVTESFYSDSACATLTWASNPVPLKACVAGRVGMGPDLTCTAGSCGTVAPTSGSSLSYYYDKSLTSGGAAVHSNPKNYAKLRYYQDANCKKPTTYQDPSTTDVSGKSTYNGANMAQTGVPNTAGTNFTVGEQVYDGWALGQARYFEVDYGSGDTCTKIETGVGDSSGAVNSIKCSTSICTLYASNDCTGSAISTISQTEAVAIRAGASGRGCNADLYAKVESFKTGIEFAASDFLRLEFYDQSGGAHGETYLSTECGGRPTIVQGLLDTCQVNADVSKGHTWDSAKEYARCSGDWENEYAAATIQPTVQACKDLCHSTVDCKAISWGRDGDEDGAYQKDNHKCVLCKSALTEGNGYWDAYTKSADTVPTFVKVTGGRLSTGTIHTEHYSTSDCTGTSFADPEVRNIATCRAVKDRAGAFKQGVVSYASSMSPLEKVQGVLGQAFNPAGVNTVSDQVGCPEVMNYVYTEGEYDVGNSNGVNDHRVCTIKFQGPPGTTLSFDWSAFALQSGLCSGTPLNCNCPTESVTIRDGLREDSQQVGQPLCGSTFNGGSVPNRIVFSGNTARIDFEATAETSTFKVWVNHHVTKVNFHLPANPTFALGSDISIDWSLDTSVGGWAECGQGQNSITGGEQSQLHGVGRKTQYDERWQRRFTCARSSQSDHGWIGIYRNGTCEDGAMIPHAVTNDPNSIKAGFRANAYSQGQQPHECYLGYRTIPVKETRGTVIFKFDEDYKHAGWYSLRYFAGDSAGTLCEVLSSSKVYDPENIKNEMCLYEPITRGEIYVTASRSSFSGVTEKSQLPGYERTINY